MAEDAPQQAGQAGDAEQKPKGSGKLKIILIVAGVFLMEVGTVVVFKMMHSDKVAPAEATEEIGPTQEAPGLDMAEVVVCEGMTVDNWGAGATKTMVNLDVIAEVEFAKKEELSKRVTDHAAQLKDRIRTVVSDAQPEQLKDPQLQVIKREIKMAIDKIVGEGYVDSVWVSGWQANTLD